MAEKILAMPKGPRFRATRRATACLVLSASIAIAGCSERKGNPVDMSGAGGFSSSVNSWTDPKTGCEYLIYDRKSYSAGMGGITPRLGRDGEPMCTEGK